MKRIGTPVVALSLAMAAFATAATPPAGYATQFPLQLERDDAGAYRVMLDEAVYREVRDPALRDLAVINAQGSEAPSALFAADAPLTVMPKRVELPWFPLPATNAGGRRGWELVSDVGADGSLRRVEARSTDPSTAALPRTALLLDASSVRGEIAVLELQWQAADAFDLGYRVESSEDLDAWQPVASSGRLVDLQRAGERLVQRRLQFTGGLPDNGKPRYLRLTPDRSNQVIAVTGVVAELAPLQVQATPAWLELAGQREGSSGQATFEFDLNGRFPVALADVALAGNHAVEWRLESRDSAGDAWTLRAGPWMAYRVDSASAGSVSPARALGAAVRDRHWRLRASAAITGTPTLRLGYHPEAVVFLAQGDPPYVLAAGSAQARRADAPIAQLVEELRRQRGSGWQPGSASLGDAQPLAGEAALLPVRDWRSWLLWAVLALGALVVAGFAFSLLRGKPQA